MITVIGIDPDYHNTGVVTIENGRITEVRELTVPASVKGEYAVHDMIGELVWLDTLTEFPRLVVIEGQEVYANKTEAKNAVVGLAHISGAAAAMSTHVGSDWLMPLPKEWKRNLDKKASQKNIMRRLGFGYDELANHLRPLWPWDIKTSHVIDAAGLALWGYDKLLKEQMLEEELGRTAP